MIGVSCLFSASEPSRNPPEHVFSCLLSGEAVRRQKCVTVCLSSCVSIGIWDLCGVTEELKGSQADGACVTAISHEAAQTLLGFRLLHLDTLGTVLDLSNHRRGSSMLELVLHLDSQKLSKTSHVLWPGVASELTSKNFESRAP